jgi:predicted nucleic acid-binding protein
VNDIWVVNASPIIVLAKAGLERLATDLASEILVPEAVVAEVLAGPESDPARRLLESGWGRRVAPANVPTAVVEWGLGAGEMGVIAVGLETESCTVVLDDALGRSCARLSACRRSARWV